jgi:hypothetical protein
MHEIAQSRNDDPPDYILRMSLTVLENIFVLFFEPFAFGTVHAYRILAGFAKRETISPNFPRLSQSIQDSLSGLSCFVKFVYIRSAKKRTCDHLDDPVSRGRWTLSPVHQSHRFALRGAAR